VRLLETNQKEFVEYRLMCGLQAMSIIGKLMAAASPQWMQINPKARPMPNGVLCRHPLVAPFRPPVED
jgi:hypothetical protein